MMIHLIMRNNMNNFVAVFVFSAALAGVVHAQTTHFQRATVARNPGLSLPHPANPVSPSREDAESTLAAQDKACCR